MTNNHHVYMQRAIELAKNGLGNVAPNPLVGAVIVHNDVIVGEGWHQKYGEAHAEVNAVNSVSEEHAHLLPESTIYVNLEPCSHYGKTPPCANLLVEKGFKTVVVANLDPNPLVAGKGIKVLEDAGIEVIVGIEEQSGTVLNKRFFTFHNKQRPYVILKWAQTANGYFAPKDGSQQWITGEISRKLVHKWRSEEAAIMVGTNTVKVDNPKLDTRLWPSGNNPTRIVLDRKLELPKNLHVFDDATKTIVFTEKTKESTDETSYVTLTFDDKLIQNIVQELHKLGVQSVFVEGGAILLNSFIAANLWDEALQFTGQDSWDDGILAPTLSITPIEETTIGGDRLSIYVNS